MLDGHRAKKQKQKTTTNKKTMNAPKKRTVPFLGLRFLGTKLRDNQIGIVFVQGLSNDHPNERGDPSGLSHFSEGGFFE